MIRSAGIVALSLGCLSSTSGAVLIYTFTGELTSAASARNEFEGLEVGDAFEIVVGIDTTVMPTSEDATQRRWDVLGVLTQFEVTFPDRMFDYLEASGFHNGEIVNIEDDAFTEEPGINDIFELLATGHDALGFGAVTIQTQGVAPDTIDVFDGLDFPTEEELDPEKHDSARITLSGTRVGTLRGDITGVTRVPSPGAALVIGGLGALGLRRKRSIAE